MNKILFLDIDGVLNSCFWFSSRNKNLVDKIVDRFLYYLDKITLNKFKAIRKERHYRFGLWQIDPNSIDILRKIIYSTHCKIVISSTWRWDTSIDEFRRIFAHYNFYPIIIGTTPILHTTRGEEIGEFLSTLSYNPRFVILDDNSDMGNLSDHLIKTDHNIGITLENAKEAIERLND